MQADFVIVGAGILGLSIAFELRKKYPKDKILLLDKECELGLHASGRNSGILHAGIYYKSDSLKAKFCLDGLREMAQYCETNKLPINKIGKIILPTNAQEEIVLQDLYKRSQANGSKARLINNDELREMEPYANCTAKNAIFSPETAVIAPKKVVSYLYQSLQSQGVQFKFNSLCDKFLVKQKKLFVNNQEINYGHLFNTAGLYSDVVARACGISDEYTMLPFKGMYYELNKASAIKVNHLIYPVPDMNVPFLGVHFTKSIDGKIYIGPTAIPVLGREHYSGFNGINIGEALKIFSYVGLQYFTNKQGFRNYAHQEIPRFIKKYFITQAQAMIPNLKSSDIIKSKKVGIRAQLYDTKNRELAMDFIVRNAENSTHILNAVSPAFTSSFSFAKYVVGMACSSA